MLSWFAGLLFGLTMILPIGAQNLFVLQQGLAGGWPRGLLAAVTAGVCDTLLILLGGLGASTLITALPLVQFLLFLAGGILLVVLGWQNLRQGSESLTFQQGTRVSIWRQIAAGIGVSWGNPHAILDTVVVLGAAITAQQSAYRAAFAAGTITASWLFFLVLATIGTALRQVLSPAVLAGIRRLTGVIMLGIAAWLGIQAVLLLHWR